MKNNKNIIILIIALIGVIVLTSVAFWVIKSQKLTDKNSVNVYFVKSSFIANNQQAYLSLTPVRRKISPEQSRISTAITELLKGPSKKEKKEGFYTEIPLATKLIAIKESHESVIIDLSKDFESGGGSTSMIMRLKQLVNTALDAAKDKPVYLELNDKKIDFIGGEGVIVSQPLSR